MNSGSVSRRRSLFVWGVCCLLAGGVFVAYAAASLAAGRGQYMMALDDVYIHFQYARQMAAGQPYIYNPGLPPTSGATSFLYPYLLAFGVLLGFDGLNLGVWAMGLGFVALVGSAWLVYRLGRLYAPGWVAFAVMVMFALSGPIGWHFMSGMETGLVTLFLLATLYGFAARRLGWFVAAASLLVLIRPEGGALAVVACVAYRVREIFSIHRPLQTADDHTAPTLVPKGEDRTGAVGSSLQNTQLSSANRSRLPSLNFKGNQRPLLWLLLPVVLLGLQPLVNWAVTGSAVASGNQSKSIFGMIPPYGDVILGRLLDQFRRAWEELATGFSPREGIYFPFLLAPLALIGMVGLAIRRRWLLALLIVGWLMVGLAAIATLDTAFWHFKRYQIPLLALLFPLAAWAGNLTPHPPLRDERVRNTIRLVFSLSAVVALVVCVGIAAGTGVQFWRHFLLNGHYVYAQPYQMALWLRENTPDDVLVAVHDTGMMRYMGERTTLDFVGLTTPGAAESWRNGPGAVAELLDTLRPDLIASYGRGHGLGLDYLAETPLYAEELAFYPVARDPAFNVALAADYQGIYRPDWTTFEAGEVPHPHARLSLSQPSPRGEGEIFTLDVANLESEAQYHYQWRDDERLTGFPTEVQRMDYIACAAEGCTVTDGGRRINGEESFEFTPPDGTEDLLLVTRVHPAYSGTLDVYINDTLVDTQWIPAQPGQWMEIATLLPRDWLDNLTRIRIVPHIPGGHYMPYHHWIYPVTLDTTLPADAPVTTFQDGAIRLYDAMLTLDSEQLVVDLTWGSEGDARGDYKIFVHVQDAAGTLLAQGDSRPGGGTLPPGNWLRGTFRDTIVINLSQLPQGQYSVVMGLYDPITFERLTPSGGDEANRFFIGTVELE